MDFFRFGVSDLVVGCVCLRVLIWCLVVFGWVLRFRAVFVSLVLDLLI